MPPGARPGVLTAMMALAAAAAWAQAPPPAGAPLAVPYLTQSVALCGGAAAAMVERYWGARRVFPEDFTPLLNTRGDGIETGVLARAMAARGWHALAFEGSLELLGRHVGEGRPVIALIAVGPRRYHYVVVLSVGDTVVYHDPAVGPRLGLPAADFDKRWAAARRWSLLLTPGDGRPAATPEAVASGAAEAPAACRGSVDDAARLAASGRYARAEALLVAARAECPDASAPWRELAGIRLLERRPGEALPLARSAVERDPTDTHAWRVLATAAFLERRPLDALAAWNRAGEPVVDLLEIEGLTRTRHRAVADRISLVPGTLLTPDGLTRAERRLQAMPAMQRARVEVLPAGSGLASIRAAVVERPPQPAAPLALAAAGLRAGINREAGWHVSSPTGRGERVDLWARWWEARPGGGIALRVPVDAAWLSGTLLLEGRLERETYATGDPLAPRAEDHRSAVVGLSDWITGDLRWEGQLRVDRWAGRSPALAVGGALDHRTADHSALRAQARVWPGPGIATLDLGARWRWRRDRTDRVLTALNASLAGGDAPRVLWAGAGTGHGRALLLRAHPLLDDGVIDAGGIGRRVVHGTLEVRHPVGRRGPITLGLAAFADAAAVWRGDGPRRRHVDVGVGARIGIAGEGALRVDFARGLADGRHAVSAGWDLPWPWWP